MSANIDTSNDRINMAHTEDTPVWWGVGNIVDPYASAQEWAEQAGLTFRVNTTPVLYQAVGDLLEVEDRQVLYRDDTQSWLHVASNRYKVHQPAELVETFEDIIKIGGYKMKTMGSLDGGRKIWGLAEAGDQYRVAGQDVIEPYIVLSSSYDGTSTTRATRTNVCVVCQNTFELMLRDSVAVTISHRNKYDKDKVLEALGFLDGAQEQSIENIHHLVETKMSEDDIKELILRTVFMGKTWEQIAEKKNSAKDSDIAEWERNTKKASTIFRLYENAPGQDFKGRKGTAWGAFNAVTNYVDHHMRVRGKAEGRLDSAWYGNGKRMKEVATRLLLAA